mmetsp:Transcript_4027/g.8142  ORF Transcript_4027/g.8142 Transcript_4027/m.8142 type:complete len:486 (+) Transcript_4027:1440-2897(+)
MLVESKQCDYNKSNHRRLVQIGFRAISVLAVAALTIASVIQSTRVVLTTPEHILFANDPSHLLRLAKPTEERDLMVQQRNITFLKLARSKSDGSHDAYGQRWFQEAYSGMFWTSTHHFLSIDWEPNFNKMPITASIKAFGGGRARQTLDWLDFAVEHLSIFWKHFDAQPDDSDKLVYTKMEETLQEYVNNVPASKISFHSPAPETIALLPFSGDLDKSDATLRELAAAATLASLWQIGVGRAVIVGHSADERKMIHRAMTTLATKLRQRPFELAYIEIENVTIAERKLMPKVALRGLKAAMLHSLPDEEVRQWLGTDPSRWKFVYFAEPDLILHTRPTAMDAIRREIENGGVLTAHRLMPLPHQRSFPHYERLDKVIPDVGMFSLIHNLDGMGEDACCDTGDYYPSNPTDPHTPQKFLPCGKHLVWWRCGFFKDPKTDNCTDVATVAKLHYRVPHPLVSLSRGTGWPLIHNNQRVCIPRRLGECD